MAITANAWVNSTGAATITFWSSEGWTDGSWNLAGSVGSFPSPYYISLYNLWSQNGVGVIDGAYLTIFIASCPEGEFSINTQWGAKEFMLSEGDLSFGAALVGANNVNLNNYEAASQYFSPPKKSLVYFGGDLKPFKGRIKAQLQIEGKLHATVGGNAVDSVNDSRFDSGYWAIPSAIFMDFYWVEKPTIPTVYDFIFKEEKRVGGGGKIMSFKVEMDLNQVYSPLSTGAYPVESTNIFEVSLTEGLEVNE